MIITKVQLAAMERVRIPEENRKDFYLYVDEFQNFVTDAFASILSEARKYRLNLTVAHQYTAQLISDKSSAVRDAVFGNVGTMIVFRVGSDDADFLEKEFDPEFTPGDIVNLPNYKVYLKLMIDGVTSRPFSAKTLPPLVKSGNKEVEAEVIQSSRELYCKPKAWIENEINRWSGMSLGDMQAVSAGLPLTGNGNGYSGSAGTTAGGLEKFPIICSMCGLEKTVPFKPEPGRPVYCKECTAKIKSGEVKVAKGGDNQVKFDDSQFYKPLADLGIEFPSKTPQEKIEPKVSSMGAAIKKAVFGNAPVNKKENIGLKEIISKTLSGDIAPIVPSTPAPISLNALKEKVKEVPVQSKDRAASKDDMNKLKDLIMEKTPASVAPAPVSQPLPTQVGTPTQVGAKPPAQPQPITPPAVPSPKNLPIKEVPEEVLRKILEE
jgi:CxxC-x17-CxxC domain-containing protein